ncbi:hypothetical protein F5Y09DRAFT_330575 [Xylaria sp. FL1042]|nr:hypothetical protein F5Y09DRAFT_330575 [Xylaria sp. FL1042]
MSTTPHPLKPTTEEILPEHAFRAVIWFAVGICTVASAVRFGIRLICWRRLLPEDYLMLLSLLLLATIAGVLQRYVGDIYYLTHLQNGLVAAGPDTQSRVHDALRAGGIVLVVGATGTYIIKLNFLFFFYRIGNHVRAYLIAWWVSIVFVVASLAINLGVIPYKCSFGNIVQSTVECTTESSLKYIYTVYKLAVAFDVVCDGLIIAFPIMITWRTKLSLRQKAVLSAVFLLVGFTIGVTIVRVSIFNAVYNEWDKVDRKVFDTAWVLFWLFVEYLVSFIINCIISFRSLWVNHKSKAKDEAVEREKQEHIIMAGKAERGLRFNWQAVRQTVLDTLGHLEGTNLEQNSANFIEIDPLPENMTVNFPNWGSTQNSQELFRAKSDNGV